MSNTIATPERIRRSIRENVVTTVQDDTILQTFPLAEDLSEDPDETFFIDRAHAAALQDERFSIIRQIRPVEQVETSRSLIIGETFQISPNIPIARLIDKKTDLDVRLRVVGFSIDLNTGRSALELRG